MSRTLLIAVGAILIAGSMAYRAVLIPEPVKVMPNDRPDLYEHAVLAEQQAPVTADQAKPIDQPTEDLSK